MNSKSENVMVLIMIALFSSVLVGSVVSVLLGLFIFMIIAELMTFLRIICYAIVKWIKRVTKSICETSPYGY